MRKSNTFLLLLDKNPEKFCSHKFGHLVTLYQDSKPPPHETSSDFHLTNAGEEYLVLSAARNRAFPLDDVREGSVRAPCRRDILLRAGYERRGRPLRRTGIRVRSVHRRSTPARAIRRGRSDLCVGGGNTFALAKKMQNSGLMRSSATASAGIPCVGWSAGSNVCCPTISTTNDMPIVEPRFVPAIGAVKFQINPHYRTPTLQATRAKPANSVFRIYRGQSAPVGGRSARGVYASVTRTAGLN